MKKYLKRLGRKQLLLLISGFLLVFAYLGYYHAWPWYEQWQRDHEVSRFTTDIHDIHVFGPQNRYVIYKTESGGDQVLANYLVGSESKYVGRGSKFPVEYSLVVHDLRKPDFPSKKIDVTKLIQDYDDSYAIYIYTRRSVTVNQKDYLVLTLMKKENENDKKEVALDIEAGQFVSEFPKTKENEDDFDWPSFAFSYTNLDKIMGKNGFLAYGHLTYDERDDRLKSKNINFTKDYPEIFDEMKNKGTVVIRLGDHYDMEALFQDMRHWFAPVGQDKLDVIATDPKTKEETPINSFEEYKDWRIKHGSNL